MLELQALSQCLDLTRFLVIHLLIYELTTLLHTIKEFKRFLSSNLMLLVCTNIKQFHTFAEKFKQMFEPKKVLDLSKVPCSNLAAESLAIVNHHSDVAVFLGYLEPGWMLEPAHQVQLRKLDSEIPSCNIN